jgi:predicted RNA-binding Zn-ribbon protein involved in translation (DUF1610 family)
MSSANWFANKLGPAAPARPVLPPIPVQPAIPVAAPNWTAPSPQQYPQVTEGQQQQPPPQDQYRTSKTTFDRNSDQCPECGSGNYMKPADPRSSSGYRCYDCGYPVMQTTSNMPSMPTGESGPVRASRQVSTSSNYNPQTIVGRVGD